MQKQEKYIDKRRTSQVSRFQHLDFSEESPFQSQNHNDCHGKKVVSSRLDYNWIDAEHKAQAVISWHSVSTA